MTYSNLSRVLLFLVGWWGAGSTAARAVSLPMPAVVTDGIGVYSGCQHSDFQYHYLPENTLIVVYEANEKCLRILPEGSAPAWIPTYPHVDYRPEAPAPTEYVGPLTAAYEYYVGATTVTACGVTRGPAVVQESDKGEPDGQRTATPGDIYWVFNRRDEWAQVRGPQITRYEQGFEWGVGSPPGYWQIEKAEWIAESDLLLSEPFPAPGAEPGSSEARGRGRCFRRFDSPLTYLALKDDGYRAGPLSDSSIEGFYKAGEELAVIGQHANGWLRTRAGWLPPGDAFYAVLPVAAITTAESLRLRAAPALDAEVLLTLPEKGSAVVLYERRGDWYRLTPDDFQRQAWSASQFLSPQPGFDFDTAYLQQIPAVAVPPAQAPAQRASGRGSGVPSCFTVLATVVGVLVGAILLIVVVVRFRKQLLAIASAAWISLLVLLYDLWTRRRLQRAQAAAGGAPMTGKSDDDEPELQQRPRGTPAPRTPSDLTALSNFSERPTILGTKIAALAHEKKLSIVQRARLAEIQAKTELAKALTDYGRSQEELEHYTSQELADHRRTTSRLEHEAKATEAELRLLESQKKLAEAKKQLEAARAAKTGDDGERARKRSAAERIVEEADAQEKTAREAWQRFEEKKAEWEKLRDAGSITDEECRRRVENLRDRIRRKLEEQEV